MNLRITLLALAACATAAFAAEPKKVIVCTVTTGFRHSSIPHAEEAIKRLSEESKAFSVVEWVRQPATQVPRSPQKPKDLKADADDKAKAKYAEDLAKYEAEFAKWEAGGKAAAETAKKAFDGEMKAEMAKLSPENLAKVDGVIFANTTGDLPLPDKEGFITWIRNGGGFMAMHSGSDTFHGFRPYIDMLQGEFETHGAQVPADLIVADKAHPSTKDLPDPWQLKQEEMYLIKSHDRTKLRTLLFMNHHPNHKDQPGYFPVAWCRMEGKGRVFYTSLGHREDLWSTDPGLKDRKNPVETAQKFNRHILGGIQWALGLAPGSADPIPNLP
jgi:type 1 glutamine amidotransferase